VYIYIPKRNGICVSSEINGKIECECFLSGMPELVMTFKDPTLIDDVSFHPCVKYARYEQDQSLYFVPPDGKFDLIRYRYFSCSY